ncbi:ABC transporter ATP-binding protein [Aliterella atlantica]|uniref:Sugar ABC transporter ATP-binding protein n=1 Tax=Aliterella atlantica CENA595 TaxID=1618023 RepID=A0A0D8ZX44_9CYAN|nr:ABC transporter ATP-binding protein [Aliterella atlantica]KJH73019.1 sugar ABC transporter ATP-binding protein [Aliterella atlantica CENA595]
MANVRLEGIKRRFNNVSAIEDISFEVPDGQFWVLVGPSGCGKSTVLRTIAGLESATEGNLYIGDVLVNNIPARHRDVAMVFQNYALYPHMTVAENIAFGLQMRKVEAKIIRERVQVVAQSLALEHLLDRKPKQLSGGQQQRVALGRAIARQPQVFLLDEPLSNLDAQLRDDTRVELKQLHQKLGITTIYVTHDQTEAMTLGDRIVVLERGRIQQIGAPGSIYAKPANRMVATFLGNPAMNIMPATYRPKSFQVGEQYIECPIAVREKLQPQEGQKFNLGIRSENMYINTTDNDVETLYTTSLQVIANVIEPLGRETLIRSEIADLGVQINVQADRNIQAHSGDRISLALDLDQLFVFDSNTGIRLYP